MKCFVVLALFVVTVSSRQRDTTAHLHRIIATGNCSSLLNFKYKLSGTAYTSVDTTPNNEIINLHEQVNHRINELRCSDRRRRQTGGCAQAALGDGWCDQDCNKLEYNWDGGDCCPQTCKLSASYKCGSGGYYCASSSQPPGNIQPSTTVPDWFRSGVRLCFNWNYNGDPGQCGLPGSSKHLCAGINALTSVYWDGTDNRPGGCLMSWGIESDRAVPEWFREVSICFRVFPDNREKLQCGGHGLKTEVCAKFGTYTPDYLDDTSDKFGGCQMGWKLSVPSNAEPWIQNVHVCIRWEPDQMNAQCGNSGERNLCGIAGMWSPYYRDETASRPGGCRMQWGLQIP